MLAPRRPDPRRILDERIANASSPREARAWMELRRDWGRQAEAEANGRNRRILAIIRSGTTSVAGLGTLSFGAYLAILGDSPTAGVFIVMVAAGLLGLSPEFLTRAAEALSRLQGRRDDDGNESSAD